ncbi:MAG TPA: hypothetical protein VF017_05820 [Thermoanaerobaculia bacterium]|nr:hypothetical protein [Thermoanaerobaculia bacterium]
MHRNAAAGWALILGSVGMLVTMTFHPTGGSAERIVQQATLIRLTHGLALASIPLVFAGFLGLSRRLAAAPVLADLGLVAYGFGSVAGMIAGTLNGFVAPAFVARIAADAEGSATFGTVLRYSFHANAAFAVVSMVAWAAATLLFSLAIWRTGALARWTGGLGILLGALGLVVVLGGQLVPTVHGFGLFVLGSSAWTIGVGALLCRPSR